MNLPELVIRDFEPRDKEAFRTLNEHWIQKYFQIEEEDRKALNDPETQILAKGGYIFMAERGGEPVGCCALLDRKDGRFEVSKMTVAESERGQGVGRQLLDHVIAFATREGRQSLFLETNTKLETAIRLYESVGFRHIPAERRKPSPYTRSNVSMELLLPVYPFLLSESALQQLMAAFESRTLPKEQWTHGAHVAACAFYNATYGPAEALRRMRENIPLYNIAVGGKNTEESGYHETLTCLWAQIIAQFLAALPAASPFAAVEATVRRYGQERKLHEAFYTFDVVTDRQARRQWIPPDKQP